MLVSYEKVLKMIRKNEGELFDEPVDEDSKEELVLAAYFVGVHHRKKADERKLKKLEDEIERIKNETALASRVAKIYDLIDRQDRLIEALENFIANKL